MWRVYLPGALALAWFGFTNLHTYFNSQMRNSGISTAFSTRLPGGSSK